MHTTSHPLLCDPATGACEIPAADSLAPQLQRAGSKPLKLLYFTDPICSSCWGIEPQLRKLKLEYGDDLDIEYRMGGLLPDWSYNSGGISKPSDVAQHWDEASQHYEMPIDGDLWLEDPLSSSYPPSIALKAAQLQDAQKAAGFLRTLRELVFLHKKNIATWAVVAEAAGATGLDTGRLRRDCEGPAKALFEEDLQLARRMGVRGFPSIFISDRQGHTEFIYGSRPYSEYESAIVKLHPAAVRRAYAADWQALFAQYPSMATKEFAVLSGLRTEEAAATLEALQRQGRIQKFSSKNGPMWRRD